MIEYPRHYFEDEVREGFYVPGMMKRVWAAQFAVLEEVDRLCKKHGLKWFADFGTLMGAVRHGGFIPWDDDIDISMLRDDYEEFLKIASEELSENYFLQNMHTDDVLYRYMTVFTYGDRINFDPEYLEKNYDCYMPVGLDIFPLDYLCPDDEKEEKRWEFARKMYILADKVTPENEDSEEYKKVILDAESKLGISIDKSRPMRQQMYEATEALFKLFPSEGAEHVVLMGGWLGNKSHKYSVDLFRDTVLVPFECGHIPVPIGYDKVLSIEYGDYMRPVMAGGMHDYPYYEHLEEFLIRQLSDYSLHYSFKPEHLDNPERFSGDHIKKQSENYMATMIEAHKAVVIALSQGDGDTLFALLQMCQEYAINIGNLIEKAYGEGYAAVVPLEEYCEGIYELSNAIASGEFGPEDADGVAVFLDGLAGNVCGSIKEYVTELKEMLFIPFRADYWNSLSDMWKKAKAEGIYHVTVMPIPYYNREADTSLSTEYYEGAEFPDELEIVDYRNYDVKLRHPEVIVTQQPFDECNHTVSVKTEYYSANLKKYTEELIYVTPFITDEIEDKNGKAWKMMNYYCTVPGVVHADKVIVQSERMRQSYIDKLSEFAGEEYRKVWEQKIIFSEALPEAVKEQQMAAQQLEVMGKLSEDRKRIIAKADGTCKKVVLYHMSISSLAHYGKQAIDKLKDVRSLFCENKDDIALLWYVPTELRIELKKLDLAVRDEFIRCMENFKIEGWGVIVEEPEHEDLIMLADAYYGDACHIAHEMRLRKKPVMLQNVEIIGG